MYNVSMYVSVFTHCTVYCPDSGSGAGGRVPINNVSISVSVLTDGYTSSFHTAALIVDEGGLADKIHLYMYIYKKSCFL